MHNTLKGNLWFELGLRPKSHTYPSVLPLHYPTHLFSYQILDVPCPVRRSPGK